MTRVVVRDRYVHSRRGHEPRVTNGYLSNLARGARFAFQNRDRIIKFGKHVGRSTKSMYDKYKARPGRRITGAAPVSYKKGGVWNFLASKTSMRTVGKKNLKRKATRKKVKVSKKLRAKISKVCEAKKGYGAVYTIGTEVIGIADTAATFTGANRVQTLGPYANQPVFIAAPQVTGQFRFGDLTWWGWGAEPPGIAGMTSTRGREFIYFTPGKILDAASQLWNQKAFNVDAYIQGNNLNGSTSLGTGLPIVGPGSSPETNSLKIDVINSYVKWTMKNASQRVMKVKIYNLTPRIRHPDSTPLQDLVDCANREMDDANVSRMMGVGSDGATIYARLCHPMFTPGKLPSFNSTWKWECMTMVMAPGETCTHSIQGPKNYLLDFAKLYADGDDNTSKMLKGMSVACMVSVEPDIVVSEFPGSNILSLAGPYTKRTNDAVRDFLTNPISIATEEVFKLAMPDIVGFIKNNAATGATQLLNLHKKRLILNNKNQIGTTSSDYMFYNEENPADDIPEGPAA